MCKSEETVESKENKGGKKQRFGSSHRNSQSETRSKKLNLLISQGAQQPDIEVLFEESLFHLTTVMAVNPHSR